MIYNMRGPFGINYFVRRGNTSETLAKGALTGWMV
jgi:hypothetical protein